MTNKCLLSLKINLCCWCPSYRSFLNKQNRLDFHRHLYGIVFHHLLTFFLCWKLFLVQGQYIWFQLMDFNLLLISHPKANDWCTKGYSLLSSQQADRGQTQEYLTQAMRQLDSFLTSSQYSKLGNLWDIFTGYDDVITKDTRAVIQQVIGGIFLWIFHNGELPFISPQ